MPQSAPITNAGPSANRPVVAPLAERDLPEAERIFRVAFGTFLGVPEPETFWSDRDYVYGRWRAPHVAALGATLDGRLVGSNFATRWGSVGFFGPITVDRSGSAGTRDRQRIARRDDGPVRRLGNHSGRAVHLRAQCQARGSVSEVRVSCALPDRDHVGTGTTRATDGGLVALQCIERCGAGRGAACQHGR